MTHKLAAALSELSDALTTLDADRAAEAVDIVCDSEKYLAEVTKRCLRTELCGVGYMSKYPPLTLTIWDADASTVYATSDPIQELIDGWGDPSKEETARVRFDLAYAALQSGIDRLRAYEAECLKAQS